MGEAGFREQRDAHNEDRSVFTRVGRQPDAVLRYGTHAEAVIDIHGGAHLPTLAILVHGGFWSAEHDRLHLRAAAASLPEHGIQAASLEYRRIAGSPHASVDDVMDGIARAFTYAAGRRVVVIGHSAGAHLTLVAATRPDFPSVDAIIALAPVADVLEAERLRLDDDATSRFLGGSAIDHEDLDPMRLPAPMADVIVMHGDRDIRVPISMGRAYAVHAGATFIELADRGHFELIDPEHPVWNAVIDSLTT